MSDSLTFDFSFQNHQAQAEDCPRSRKGHGAQQGRGRHFHQRGQSDPAKYYQARAQRRPQGTIIVTTCFQSKMPKINAIEFMKKQVNKPEDGEADNQSVHSIRSQLSTHRKVAYEDKVRSGSGSFVLFFI